MKPSARFPNKAPSPGVYYGVPADEYHSWSAVSSSMLKAMSSGPKACRHFLDKPGQLPTAVMRFGTAVGAALFEPEVYAAATEIDGLGPKARPETFAKHAAERGPIVLASGWRQEIADIIAEVERMPEAAELADGGRAEVSVVWDETTISGRQIRCKSRIDYCQPSRMVECKWTGKLADFENHAWRMNYHIQVAHELVAWVFADSRDAFFGTSDPEVAMLVLSSGPPVDVVPFYPDADWIDSGDLARARLLDKIAECLETDTWPGVARESRRTLGKPRWAREA